jgi:hypothetical protein
MKVYVNDIQIEIFRGGRAKDAILKYLSKNKMQLCINSIEIRDEWDNVIAEDSPMKTGSKIYFKEQNI